VKKLALGILSIALISLAPIMPSARAQADNQSIVGTWTVTVTVNTPAGAPPFVFTDFIAFNQGGTLTAASSTFNAHTSENPHLLPLPPLVVDTSDGYGVWKSTDDDPARVVITFKRFLFAGAATSQALYGPFVPGQYVGVNAVQAEGTLQDGGHLAGSFTTQFTNLTNLGGGPPTFAGTGTFTATRLTN
jgi:hypothetical protein